MARYKIKKKRKEILKADAFVETTEDWFETLRKWVLPIVLGAGVAVLLVVLWTWAKRAEAERLDKLWARLYTLEQEKQWNDDAAGKWDALLAESAGTAVEPQVLLRYAGKMIGEVKPDRLHKAVELLKRVEDLGSVPESMSATAAETCKQIEALLEFKPGTGGSEASPILGPTDKETSLGPGAAGAVDAKAAANAAGTAKPGPGGAGDAAAGVGGDAGGANAAVSGAGASGSRRNDERPAPEASGSAAAPAQGEPPAALAPAGTIAPQGPATSELAPSDAPRKRDPSEEEQVRKRLKPPP